MKIKDLFIEKKSYIVEYPLNHDCYLFIEALDENGCSIMREFNIDEVKNVLVELSDDCGYYIETLYGITLDTTIKEVVQQASLLLGEE